MRSDPGAAAAVLALGWVAAMALVGPAVTPDPLAPDFTGALQPPSTAHLMGTDGLGRDVLARVVVGARISLLVGGAVVVLGLVIGMAVGLAAGIARGLIEEALMRLMDILLAFPTLMLAMALTIALGSGLGASTLGVTLASIPWFARMARAETLRILGLPLVESAIALGAGRWWLVRRHVLPNMAATMVIQATSALGSAILAVAALGFLGLGAQIPTPEWGAMITDGLEATLLGAWWTTVFPGLAVLLVVGATNVLADRLRDLLDPKGAHRHRIAVPA